MNVIFLSNGCIRKDRITSGKSKYSSKNNKGQQFRNWYRYTRFCITLTAYMRQPSITIFHIWIDITSLIPNWYLIITKSKMASRIYFGQLEAIIPGNGTLFNNNRYPSDPNDESIVLLVYGPLKSRCESNWQAHIPVVRTIKWAKIADREGEDYTHRLWKCIVFVITRRLWASEYKKWRLLRKPKRVSALCIILSHRNVTGVWNPS